MSRTRLLLIPICMACLLPGAAIASDPSDVASEMRQQAPAAHAGAAIPSRGMHMNQVEQNFGSPQQRFEPVGNPPITRWDYDGMTVYFEYQQVIHSVIQQN